MITFSEQKLIEQIKSADHVEYENKNDCFVMIIQREGADEIVLVYLFKTKQFALWLNKVENYSVELLSEIPVKLNYKQSKAFLERVQMHYNKCACPAIAPAEQLARLERSFNYTAAF